MRVFVECKDCGERIFLDDVRERRRDYPAQIQLHCSNCGHTKFYHRNDIRAEPDGNSTAAGAILGGLAGALAGPIGVPIGAGIGSALGQNIDQEEKQRLEKFNENNSVFE